MVWEATIKANPRPTITWTCDGKDVTLDDRFVAEEDYKKKKYRLKISNIKAADAGTFKLIAVNEMGESSEEAKLKTYGMNYFIKYYLEEIIVIL